MQFRKKTSLGLGTPIYRMLFKLVMVIGILFLTAILLDKIKFPYPKNDIKKIIPNENFKVIK